MSLVIFFLIKTLNSHFEGACFFFQNPNFLEKALRIAVTLVNLRCHDIEVCELDGKFNFLDYRLFLLQRLGLNGNH
jgi:hypothetical protein